MSTLEVQNDTSGHLSPLAERALAAIAPDTMADRLSRGEPLPVLLEEAQYQGRRLANLGLSFSQVRQRLQGRQRSGCDVSRLVESEISEAFHQVRDLESRAYLRLFHAGVASSSVEELLQGALEAFSDYARAGEGRAWLLDGRSGDWRLAASTPPSTAILRCRSGVALESALRSPNCRAGSDGPTPDPTWAQRFATIWSFPIEAGAELLGVLEFGFAKSYDWLPRERELLTAAACLSALAAKKTMLVRNLAERELDVRRLLDELLTVEEAERKRIGRDLHDEAGQSMMCLRLQLELLDRELPEGEKIRSRLADVRATADRTLEEIRRVMAALAPSVLEHAGLCAALRQLVKRFKSLQPAEVHTSLPERITLPAKIELAAYRMVQELLNNVGKHAQARNVHLTCQLADERLQIVVADDGIGFAAGAGVSNRACFGLAGLRDRARLLGGTVDVRSSPRGEGASGAAGGTVVKIWIPLPGQTH